MKENIFSSVLKDINNTYPADKIGEHKVIRSLPEKYNKCLRLHLLPYYPVKGMRVPFTGKTKI